MTIDGSGPAAADAKPNKRTKVPPAEPPPKAETEREPRELAGNADVELDSVPVAISGAVNVVAFAGGVYLCRFGLSLDKVTSDGLSLGVFGAANVLADAVQYVGDGRNSVKITVTRDFRSARYILDPDGTGEGVELDAWVTSALKVHVDPEGKISASWSVETKADEATFRRLCELKSGLMRLTVTPLQQSLDPPAEDAQTKLH